MRDTLYELSAATWTHKRRMRVIFVERVGDGLLVALPALNWCLAAIDLDEDPPSAESLIGECLGEEDALILAGILASEWPSLRLSRRPAHA